MLVCKARWYGPGGRGHCYLRARNRSRLSRPPLHSQENSGRNEHHSLTHVLSMRAPASPLSQTPSSSRAELPSSLTPPCALKWWVFQTKYQKEHPGC